MTMPRPDVEFDRTRSGGLDGGAHMTDAFLETALNPSHYKVTVRVVMGTLIHIKISITASWVH